MSTLMINAVFNRNKSFFMDEKLPIVSFRRGFI